MQVKVYVDATKVRLRFQRLAPEALDALAGAAQDLDHDLVGRAKGLASGTVLQARTGKYVGAIKGRVKRTKTGVYAQAYSRDPRAALFEFGGKTAPHEIAPRSAKALLLQTVAGQTFASVVHHPGGDYGRSSTGVGKGSQGRYSVIFRAYNGMRSAIFKGLHDAATGAIEAGN